MNMELEQTPNADESLLAEPALDGVAEIMQQASGPQVPARLIEYAHGRRIALPPHTIYGLIEHPSFVEVPGAARYSYGLVSWQNKRLPLLNFDALLHADSAAVQSIAPPYALIVAYQCTAKEPLQYGAIGLTALPQTIAVGDDAQCELPDDSTRWTELALSCFQYEEEAIPIIDTARVFAVSHCQTKSYGRNLGVSNCNTFPGSNIRENAAHILTR